jgi:hypothetical protein
MRIDIQAKYCKIQYVEKGVIKQKLVTLSDLLDELSIYKVTNFGLLPKDVRVIESSGNLILIGIEFPKGKRDLNLSGRKTPIANVDLPAGIVLERLSRESGGILNHVDTFVFALRGKRVQFPQDRLYHYPLPNIYGNGKICWGSVKLGKIKKLSAVEGIASSFFANNFNGDLFFDRLSGEFPETYQGGYSTKKVQKYFTYLSKNEFQENWLSETKYSISQISTVLLKGRVSSERF